MFAKIRRVVDRKCIGRERKPYCEKCGGLAYGEPHHILSVGARGPDICENLIQLCAECHVKAHAGNISRLELFGIVARRMQKTVDAIIYIVKETRKAGEYVG